MPGEAAERSVLLLWDIPRAAQREVANRRGKRTRRMKENDNAHSESTLDAGGKGKGGNSHQILARNREASVQAKKCISLGTFHIAGDIKMNGLDEILWFLYLKINFGRRFARISCVLVLFH